jgi:hypothetical protein
VTVLMHDWRTWEEDSDARTTAREPSGSRVVALLYLQDDAITVTDFTSKSRACIS